MTYFFRHLLLAGIFFTSVTALCFFIAPAAHAISTAPNGSAWVPNGSVSSVIPAGDGINNFISGSFDVIGPPTGGFAPVNKTTGLLTTQVFPKVNGTIYAMIGDGNGGWYIGGQFTQVGGYTRNHLAHIRSDMTVDVSWNPDASLDVLSLYLDGTTLYVGGSFTSIGGQSRNYLAALNVNTGEPTPWNPDADWEVWAIAVHNTTVYIGGGFSTVNSVPRNQAAAISALDASVLPWDPDPDYYVRVLKVYGDKLYMGGDFYDLFSNSASPIYRGGIAQFELSDNSLTSWSPITDNSVSEITFNGTSMYIGGDFNDVGSQTRNGIAEIDITSATPTGWDPDLDWGDAYAIVRDGSTVYIGGQWDSVGGVRRAYLAAVDAVTAAPTGWDPVAGGDVNELAINGNTVFAAGAFVSMNGLVRDNIAKINATTGVAEATFNADLSATSSGPTSLAIAAGKLYGAGGVIIGSDSVNRSFTSFNATTGAISSLNPTFNCCVRTLITDGSTVYVGGSFLTVNGLDRWKIAAFDATTDTLTSWHAPNIFNGNTVDEAVSIAVSSTTVFIGGSFRSVSSGAGTVPRNGLAAFDKSTAALLAWDPNANLNAVVNAIALSGNTLYVGGNFTSVGGQSRSNLAAVDATTGAVSAWNPSADWFVAPPAFPVLYPDVSALTIQGSTVYVGGRFTAIGGLHRERIAAIDAVTGVATAWNPTIVNSFYPADPWSPPFVRSIVATATSVFAGGYFDTVGSQQQRGLALFQAPPPVTFRYFSTEGDESVASVSLQLLLQDIYGSDVTVDYDVTGGSATGNGIDYTLASGVATIVSGSTAATIPVSIEADGLSEPPELIQVTLSSPSNATIGRIPTMLYRITDYISGGGPTPTPTLSPTPTLTLTPTPTMPSIVITPTVAVTTDSVVSRPSPVATTVAANTPTPAATPAVAVGPLCAPAGSAPDFDSALGNIIRLLNGYDKAVQITSHYKNQHHLNVARYAVRQFRLEKARRELLSALTKGKAIAAEQGCNKQEIDQNQRNFNTQKQTILDRLEEYRQSVVSFTSWTQRASYAQHPDDPLIISTENDNENQPGAGIQVNLFEPVGGPSFQPLSFIPIVGRPLQVFVDGIYRDGGPAYAISYFIDTFLGGLEQLPLVGRLIEQLDVALTNLAENSSGLIAIPISFIGLSLPHLEAVIWSLPSISIWQLPGIFLSMIRKKRHPWGVVFDSETKQPLDPVVVTIIDQQGRRRQTISDFYGRYEFLVDPGVYTLLAEKSHYSFPSKKVAGTHDDVYEDLYYGGEVTVRQSDVMSVNIPMDATAADWNQAEKMRMDNASQRQRIVRASRLLFGLGFSWSVLMFVLYPSVINTIILVVYAMYLVWYVRRGRRPWGVVSNLAGSPVDGAVVRLTNLAIPQLKRPPVVTGFDGRYLFLVDRGNYQVTVEQKDPDGTYRRVEQSKQITIHEKFGQIGQDIRIR